MPTEELKFEDLLKEYIDVVENTDKNKLKEENSIIKVDISRKEKEVEGIDIRIEEIQSELDSLNENSTVKLEYPEVIKEKQDKIQEVKDFKEEKLQEINKLKDEIKENNKRIRKVNKVSKDVIKKAEERTDKENEKLQEKIEELKARKDKFGIKVKDKDGSETLQLTAEEKVIVNSISEDIKKLQKVKRENKKAFLLFKKTIEETKKDREAFIALKNNVKDKEEKIEPVKTEPEKTEPVKTEPEKTEPEKTEPEKTEPEKAEPEKTEPEKTEPEKTEPNNIKSGRKPEISRILVCPITNTISYELIDEKGIYGVGEEELNYTNDFVKGEYVKDLLEDEQFGLSEEQIKAMIGKVDPNVLKVLEENDKVALSNYIKSIATSEDIPFEIEYDLKDIYKSDMMYNKEKSNLSKIAKASSEHGVKVTKDNILKRAFDKIRSLINKQTRKALVEDNKTYGKVWEEYDEKYKAEENDSKDINNIQDIEENEKTKEDKAKSKKYQPRHFAPRENIISKSKSIAVSLGKNVMKNLQIANNRLSGHFMGENQLVINDRERKIRNSFVPKVKVDEKAAIEKVESSKDNYDISREEQTK